MPHAAGLSEVVAVDGQGDGQGQQLAPVAGGPREEPPVLEPLPAQDPQAEAGPEECHKTLKIQCGLDFGHFVLPQEEPHPAVVVLG